MADDVVVAFDIMGRERKTVPEHDHVRSPDGQQTVDVFSISAPVTPTPPLPEVTSEPIAVPLLDASPVLLLEHTPESINETPSVAEPAPVTEPVSEPILAPHPGASPESILDPSLEPVQLSQPVAPAPEKQPEERVVQTSVALGTGDCVAQVTPTPFHRDPSDDFQMTSEDERVQILALGSSNEPPRSEQGFFPASANASPWERYLAWNRAIADEVYSPRLSGRPAYLDLSEERLAVIAKAAEQPPPNNPSAAFLAAVRATLRLPPGGRQGTFSKHAAELLRWHMNRPEQIAQEPPPCIALLAAFSLVAVQMHRDANFGGNNYYGRLKVAFEIEDLHLQALTKDFRDETLPLWDALNRWLTNLRGSRGLATAYSLDRNRKYVGVPISQALIREQDRYHLRALFAGFGLQPGQTIAVPDMVSLLSEWLPTAPVSATLHSLWGNASAKTAIAEVACRELEAWDGTSEENGAALGSPVTQHAELLLAGELRSRPRRRFELLLVTKRTGALSPVRYELAPGCDDASRLVLNACGGYLKIKALPGTAWLELAPARGCIAFADLLFANLRLVPNGNGPFLVRPARMIILLGRIEADALYVEASRAELLREYLILADSRVADQVDVLLQKHARTGFRRLNEGLVGIPEGWVAFDLVQIESVPDAVAPLLAPLSPVASSDLTARGGFALPGRRTWHAKCPPEISFTSADSNAWLSLEVEELHPTDGIPARRCLISNVHGTGVVRLEDAGGLDQGDHLLTLLTVSPGGGTPRAIASMTLHLRTAASTEWVSRWGELGVGLDHKDPFTLITSGELQTGSEQGWMLGAVVRGTLPEAPAQASRDLPEIPRTPVFPVDETIEEDERTESTAQARVAPPNCVVQGYHEWALDPMRPGAHALVRGLCKYCGLQLWFEPRARRRGQNRRRQAPRGGPVAPPIVRRLPPIATEAAVSQDILLDALTCVSGGPWRSFEQMARQIDDSPFFAWEMARRLSALGHLELELDRRTLRPERWRITPAALVLAADGHRAFLAGARSEPLVEQIERGVAHAGGSLVRSSRDDSPSVIEVRGIDSTALAALTEHLSDKAGHKLIFARYGAEPLLRRLPRLRELECQLESYAAVNGSAEWFDLERKGRWVRAQDLGRAGAYRISSRPARYVVVSPEAPSGQPRVRIAETRIAKHLAALYAGRPLIGYDPSSQCLLVPIGAPLPGLIERAAVLCSGHLPTPTEGGWLCYQDITPMAAAFIWSAMV